MTEQTLVKHQGRALGQYQDAELIDCTACGFIHVDPLPTLDELAAVYTEKFYGSDKPEYLEKAEREQAYWREALYRYRYDTFERLLGPSSEAEKRILDIGCSGGFFLKYGLDRGWKPVGIEPSRQAAAYARDTFSIEVIQDYFQNVAFGELAASFDAVHLRNVLEHLPNPLELCEKAFECLKPGGILCIEVPNDFNPLQTMLHQEFNQPEYWVAIPHHLNYFNRESLQALVKKVGLSVVDEEGTFPMEFFLLMGDNYVGDNTLGGECHQKRMNFEVALSQTPEGRQIRQDLYRYLATLGLGRTITLFARKSPD